FNFYIPLIIVSAFIGVGVGLSMRQQTERQQLRNKGRQEVMIEIVTQELNKKSESLVAINKLTQILGANVSLELLISRILNFLHNLFNSQKTWLLFKNPKNNGLDLYSLNNEEIVWKWLSLPERKNWFYLSLFEAAHSLFLTEAQLEELKEQLFWSKETIRSLYAAPLFRGDQISGAVLLGEVKEPSAEELDTLQTMAGPIGISIERVQMYTELEENYFATIKALASSIEAKDRYTKGHSERVTRLALALGERMGLTQEELEELKYGGLLHDIGKIGIPEYILNKPYDLTTEELAEIKKHPLIGEEIISSVAFLQEIAPYIRSHHERCDGQGYPDGLKSTQLGLGVRILSVCDAFDAMSTDRPYRQAMSFENCKKELLLQAGAQFDLEVVNTLIKLLNKYPQLYSLSSMSKDKAPSSPTITLNSP
ncbi:MAG TPA: hypothetical protein DCY85_08710, partial [Firmicutes bacterium]|nr:hypothetical protein [Bacillota bacterium]